MRGYLLTLPALWLVAANPASAYTAYVSNEKGNTVSVIDTDKWSRHGDDQGRSAAAGHRIHPRRKVRDGCCR